MSCSGEIVEKDEQLIQIKSNISQQLKKAKYGVADHSTVEICHWTKKSFRNEGSCYKHKFYGISTHQCMEFSPAGMHCENRCVYCWRPMEFYDSLKMDEQKVAEPKDIMSKLMEERRKLIVGHFGDPSQDKQKIEESLKDKYNFEVSFSPEKSTNYNIYVNDIATGKYDIAIGSFFNTKWREGKIDFSSPILIDANSILHQHETSIVSNLQTVLLRAGTLILYLILMGIFFGILLYYIDPKRIKQFPYFKNSKYLFFLRSIVTGVATMFGEMGFLVENPSLNIPGIFAISRSLLTGCFPSHDRAASSNGPRRLSSPSGESR